MIFYVENHGKPIESFEAEDHQAGLTYYLNKYAGAFLVEGQKLVLRDWQKYQLDEVTLTFCKVMDSLDKLDLRAKP